MSNQLIQYATSQNIKHADIIRADIIEKIHNPISSRYYDILNHRLLWINTRIDTLHKYRRLLNH